MNAGVSKITKQNHYDHDVDTKCVVRFVVLMNVVALTDKKLEAKRIRIYKTRPDC